MAPQILLSSSLHLLLWPGVSGFQAVSGYTSVNTPAASVLLIHTKGGKAHRTVFQHSIIPHKIIFLSLQILLHWRTNPRLWLSPTLRHPCEKTGCVCPVLCESGKAAWLHAGALSWGAEDRALDSAAGPPSWVGSSGSQSSSVLKWVLEGQEPHAQPPGLSWTHRWAADGWPFVPIFTGEESLSFLPAHHCTCCWHTQGNPMFWDQPRTD